VTVAQWRGHLSGGCVAGDGVLQDGHQRIEHGDVDHLALAALASCIKRCQNANNCKQAGSDIGDRGAHARGLPALRSGEAHDATHGLYDGIIGGTLAIGPRLPKARRGRIDQPRIDLSQGVVA